LQKGVTSPEAELYLKEIKRDEAELRAIAAERQGDG
jgi:hypothetical protein